MNQNVQLELDHVFILVEPYGEIADLLVDAGLQESFSRDHPGQGTSNRRFEFSNGMLEILWIRDEKEALNGPGKDLKLVERSNDKTACPFGIIVRKSDSNYSQIPFKGWSYQPDYFKKTMAFHIGDNSTNTQEPLCIYPPFIEASPFYSTNSNLPSIEKAIIHTPVKHLSLQYETIRSANRIEIIESDQHLLELTLNNQQKNKTINFMPQLPLIIHF